MWTGITCGKYFYPFRFEHYSDIYFSILREEWESYDISNYDITKEDDRNNHWYSIRQSYPLCKRNL